MDTTTINTGIKENSDQISLEVFPNPFSNQINLKLVNKNSSKIKISLIDITGKKLKAMELKEEIGIIDLVLPVSNLNLAQGAYFLKIEIDDKGYYKKLIKE